MSTSVVVTGTLVSASIQSRVSLHCVFLKCNCIHLIAISSLNDLFLFIANSFTFMYFPLPLFYHLVGCYTQFSTELETEETVHSFDKYLLSRPTLCQALFTIRSISSEETRNKSLTS